MKFPLFVALLCIGGCSSRGLVPGEAPLSRGSGILLNSFDDLKPTALSAKEAMLEPLGTKIPVQVKTSLDGNVYRIDLISHDSVVEYEQYEVRPDAFCFSETSDEKFLPGIPIVKFPMRIGDGWQWRGSIQAGVISREATADIVTSSEVLNVLSGGDAMRVDVDLFIDSGSPVAAKRRLTFWMRPGQGVIKRAFGEALTRNPMEREN